MEEILLQYFSVKLDENGKEFIGLKYCCGGHECGCMGMPINVSSQEEIDELLDKEYEAQTVIKLQRLSVFCYKVLFINKDFKYSTIQYINFINQPLTIEQFIGEDAIFIGSHLTENYIHMILDAYKTIEQAINNGITLYINTDKI